MGKADLYREQLRAIDEWEPFLRAESGLPGPRGNLELVAAVAEEADEARLLRLLATDEEYLVVCGAAGLGRLVAEGRREHLPRLRALAVDERWRVREGVAMALQRWGDDDVGAMADEVERWIDGAPLEQRAAIAGLCEPRLLRRAEIARRALALLEQVTETLPANRDRVLRQALGYCWSVAVAALPGEGLLRFRTLEQHPDPDVRWVFAQNVKKVRLAQLL